MTSANKFWLRSKFSPATIRQKLEKAHSAFFLQNLVPDLVNQNGLSCLKSLILHSVAFVMQWVICPFCLFLLSFANFSCHPLRLEEASVSYLLKNLLHFFSTFLSHSLKPTYGPRQAAAGSHFCHPLIGEGEWRRRKMTCRHIPLPFWLCSCGFSPPISHGKNEAATNTKQPWRGSMIYQMKPAELFSCWSWWSRLQTSEDRSCLSFCAWIRTDILDPRI